MIRKLLRREHGCNGKEQKADDVTESVSDTEENENDSDTTLEISISVPNLSDIIADEAARVANRPTVQRSISDTQVLIKT